MSRTTREPNEFIGPFVDPKTVTITFAGAMHKRLVEAPSFCRRPLSTKLRIMLASVLPCIEATGEVEILWDIHRAGKCPVCQKVKPAPSASPAAHPAKTPGKKTGVSCEPDPERLGLDTRLATAITEMFQECTWAENNFVTHVNCCLAYTAWAHSQGRGPMRGEWNGAYHWLRRKQNLKRGFFPKRSAKRANQIAKTKEAPEKKRKGSAALRAKPPWWGEQFYSYLDCLNSSLEAIATHAEEYGSDEAKEAIRDLAIQAIEVAARITEPRSGSMGADAAQKTPITVEKPDHPHVTM